MSKSIFVSFLRAPVGSVFFVEGLRVAGGFVRDEGHHQVTLAFLGKGARCAVRGVDRSYAVKFLDFFPAKDGKKFYVEEESLREQGIDRSQLADEFAVATRKELGEMMRKADICVSF
jgi:sulfur relay (sulfurtransferase) DsrF/TusC family protein